MLKTKTSLTFEEKVKAAYLHYCRGIEQHVLAEIVFDGINQGRVNEACKAVKAALTEEPRQPERSNHHAELSEPKTALS